MPKRDSSFADLESPRNLKSFPRRHSAQHGSGAASSNAASSSSNAMLSWAYETVPPQRPAEPGTAVEAHQFGYTALVPSVPLPPVNPPGPSMEAYPLQSELSQNHRVLHGHIFKEVIPPPQSGQGSRLMVTEVDQYGVERNRQAEFFFNGIVGHVRSYNGGRINSWSEVTRLANYRRRHYNIPEVHDEDTSWTSSWQDRHRSYDSADNTAGTHGEEPESEMEDDTSVTVETGNVPIPSQIHQLASLLHNILLSDREYNAPILEKLETPPTDPNANPIQLFSAIDLAHVDSHLSFTSQTLAQHAQKPELDDISEISD